MELSFRMLLGEKEAMEALSIGRTLLRRMMAEGRIKGLHVGRRLVFHVDEVRRFADELQQQAEGEK